jgi:hypothetical protein
MAVAVVALLVLAVGLLRAEGGGAYALIAVWMWILPALAIFGLAGSLVAKAFEWMGARGVDRAG